MPWYPQSQPQYPNYGGNMNYGYGAQPVGGAMYQPPVSVSQSILHSPIISISKSPIFMDFTDWWKCIRKTRLWNERWFHNWIRTQQHPRSHRWRRFFQPRLELARQHWRQHWRPQLARQRWRQHWRPQLARKCRLQFWTPQLATILHPHLQWVLQQVQTLLFFQATTQAFAHAHQATPQASYAQTPSYARAQTPNGLQICLSTHVQPNPHLWGWFPIQW